MDIFEKIKHNRGPLGQHSKQVHGYFTFPKLEGPIANKMIFRDQEVLTWSINNYLGLANHPEVRKVDAEAAAEWGLAYPMGARMMSGHSQHHEILEGELAEFMQQEDAYLLNFGYQGFMSVVSALVDRKDVIVFDSECHACLYDGIWQHQGKRFRFEHNDMESFKKAMRRANKIIDETGGGILVVTEGVFGMAGDQGKLKEIVTIREQENWEFRLVVDDAHGFGTLGEKGMGAAEEQGVHDKVDIFLCTFAKSMASIGAFVASKEDVIDYLRYNMRSQIFAKSLPMPLVIGAKKRLELLKDTSHKNKLWEIASALQNGLKEAGFNLGRTDSAVTPVFLEGGVPEATALTFDLRENHQIFCSIVTYPVVPKGVIMLRLIPTASHTLEDVEYTVKIFKEIQGKLANGEYRGTEVKAVNAE